MADTKISLLTSLTKATLASNDLLPIVDTSATETKKITVAELLNPLDGVFRVAGSADNTKLVAFEVDGLTTATTRTVTVPDADLTLVGTTTTQTLTNKTLTSPQVNFGSDARGDLITRNSGGTTVRLPIGTSGQILSANASGDPEWIANPAAADASTTVKGVVEKATTAEIIAGTSAGGTSALLFIGPDAVAESGNDKILKLNSTGKIPAVDGSLITSIVPSVASKISIVTADVTTPADANQNTILSVSIPANTLGTANAVRARLHISNFTMNTNGTFILRFKYGATTMVTLTIASGGISSGAGYIDFIILSGGTTSSQEAFAMVDMMVAGAPNTNTVEVRYADVGTATEVSTGALNLVITSQGANSNSGQLVMSSAIIEKIY